MLVPTTARTVPVMVISNGEHVDVLVKSFLSVLSPSIEPSDIITSVPELEQATRIWNGDVRNRPAVLVRCRSTDQVRDAVVAATSVGLPLSVRGGGYDWAGRAIQDGAAVIDLSPMRAVQVNGDLAVAQGGATVTDLLDAARVSGFSAATGTVGAVGLTGLSLGGGYGRLVGLLGLATDNVAAAEVVLADGRVVVADAEREADLFWALRGAGGNFGVVTRLWVRLHPVAELLTGMVMFAATDTRAVLAQLSRLTAEAPDELTVMFGVIPGPEGPMTFVSPNWAGDPGADDEITGRIRELGSPVDMQIARMPVADSVHLFDEQFPPGRRYAIRTRSLPGLTAAAIEALISAVDTAPSALCGTSVHHFHGAPTRIGSAETAFSLRSNHLVVEILAQWQDGDGSDEVAWADATARALNSEALPGGYANIMGPADASRANLSYGANADRVASVKLRYDPDNVFRSIAIPQPR